ncbi:putative aminohydrolase SsnA [Bdellovibrionota bacterium FG-1]
MTSATEILLIKNATVITWGGPQSTGPRFRVLKNHSIIVMGGKIKSIRPSEAQADGMDAQQAATVIDGTAKVVLPGLINAHMHFYSTFARGLTKAAPSKNFLEVLNHLWWRLDRKLTIEDGYFSALVASMDAIKHGTTLLVDHHASPFAVRGSLSAIARAVREAGVRASLCYEVSDRDGDEVAQQGIDENLEFIESTRQTGDGYLRALFGLHASFTLSDKTLKKVAYATKDVKPGFHIHVAEDLSDQVDAQAKFGLMVVERLDNFGFLGPDTICAHGVHLDDAEVELLRKTRTIVVHNPQSNMNNAVGAADLLKLTKNGVLVGLGTDAMTTNMLEELRAAIWLQRHHHGNPSAGFVEAVEALIFGNSQIATRYWGVEAGGLFTGSHADLALLDYDPPTELNEESFYGHLVFGISQASVDTTICDGRVLMQGKKLLHLDEQQIMKEARALSKKLWERF